MRNSFLIEQANRYISVGLRAVGSVTSKKYPSDHLNNPLYGWESFTFDECRINLVCSQTDLRDAVGIICGEGSGNVEVLDFDAKGIKFDPWKKLVPPDLFAKLVVERTQSGGYHVGYRCSIIEGNQKLCGKFIETRGEGGFCVVSPSPKYELLQNSWETIQTISETERETLLMLARAMGEMSADEMTTDKSAKTTEADTPWKIHNGEATQQSVTALLVEAGWTPCGNEGHLTRPGKDQGVSGSVGTNGGFYCFTTSSDMFDGNRAYSPFAVYAIVKFNGDYKAAAKSLLPPIDNSRTLQLVEEMKKKHHETKKEFTFDLNRLPKAIVQGIAGLAARNPRLSAGYLVMLPFVFAGTLIGKRKSFNNEDNIYYPNLWACILADSSCNKSGTHNAIYNALPRRNKVGNSPTCEALLEELGKSITTKGKSRAEVLIEELKFEEESIANLDGRIMITDEITGTLKTMIGEQNQNLDNILNLATSAADITQPRIGAGKRVVYDNCFSLIGFTQPTAWNTAFNNDLYKDKGFVGRVLPCVNITVIIPTGNRNDWDCFIGGTRELCYGLSGNKAENNPFDGDADNSWKTMEAQRTRQPHPLCHEWVDKALPTLITLPVYRALADLVGTYIHKLHGKIIGHALKLSMVCELYEGKSEEHFPTMFDLVSHVFYEYFYQTLTEEAGLTSQENDALVYIKHNPGCRLRDVQRKFNLDDVKQTWNLLGRLQERDMITATESRRGSWTLFANS